ncbi:MAG: hypothetical protein FWF80_01685 [Defluviitaleaceae bacterium]|nr:hypothetical protein [Defluviitaleaceae bacterium]
MTARLYLEKEGYMTFDTGQSFFKFLVPKKLTAINEIKNYDNGYLIVDTNYGEEYVDLKAIANEIRIYVDFENITPILGRE